MILGIREYATWKNAGLIAAGVVASEATALREQFTGQRLRIGPLWAPTIGWWGGVRTLAEIAEHVDRPIDHVKSYAKARRLRYRTKRLYRSPAQLAVLALATLPAPARDAAPYLGLYPAEVCLYRAAAMELMTHAEVGYLDVLRWTPAELEARWSSAQLAVVPGPRRLDRAALVRIANEVEVEAAAGGSR